MRLDSSNASRPEGTTPGHTIVDMIDGHPVHDDGHGTRYMDRDHISGADAVRATVIDVYLARSPVTVRHVLLVDCERNWYGQTEDVSEIAGRYLDQDGAILGDHSDCWWVTWVVGAGCLVALSRRGRVRVASGGELVPSDTLLAVVPPLRRCHLRGHYARPRWGGGTPVPTVRPGGGDGVDSYGRTRHAHQDRRRRDRVDPATTTCEGT